MGFEKGKPPGPGRPPGVQNKLTTAAKEAIDLAFDGIGGVPALTEWARNNQSAFYTAVWSKLIPKNINLTGTLDFTAELDGAVEAARKRAGIGRE